MSDFYTRRWELLFFLGIFIIYLGYTLNVDQWEAYWFSASVEGLFNSITTYDLIVEKAGHLNIDIYHPYHPLLYLVVFVILKLSAFLGLSWRALVIAQNINIFFSLIGLIYIYRIVFFETREKFSSVLAMLFVATTNVYWYYGHSGEVYIASVTMLLFCFHLLQKIEIKSHSEAFLKASGIAFCYVMAFAFHLHAALFCIVIALMSIVRWQRGHIKYFYSYTVGLIFYSAIGGSLLYGFFLYFFSGAHSLDDLFTLLFVMSSATEIEWYGSNLFFHIYNFLGFKYDSFLHAMIIMDDLWTQLYKALLTIMLIFSLFKNVVRWKKISTTYCGIMIWILVYAIYFVAVLKFPVNDYWIYLACIVPLVLVMSPTNGCEKKIRIVVTSFLMILQFSYSFFHDIYPKSRADLNDWSLLFAWGEDFSKVQNAIVFLEKIEEYDYFEDRVMNEMWYLNYFMKKKGVGVFAEWWVGGKSNLPSPYEKIERSFKTGKEACDTILIYTPQKEQVGSMDLFPNRINIQEIGDGFVDRIDGHSLMSSVLYAGGCRKKSYLISRREKMDVMKLAVYPPWHRDQQYRDFHLRVDVFSR